MSKNNNKAKNSELDFVSPIVETLTPIVDEGMKLIASLIQFLLKKLFQYVEVRLFNRYQVAPIKARALKSKKMSDLSSTLGFSVNHNTPFKASELNTRKHTAIIGSTGSGKTVCTYLLIEHALKKGMPVIYFDPKASTENSKTFKKICEANNKKLYVFSDIEGHKTSFNPLLGGN